MPTPAASTLVRILVALLAGLLGVLRAAEGRAASTRVFDVPAGDAAATLRQFSAQADEQIVYMVDSVRGERTNAVQGELSARDALTQMLAGTRLTAVQDAATAAFSVKRLPWLQRVARQAFRGPRRAARPDPQSPGEATAAADDEALVLSPFEVNSYRDRGFAAAAAFAGGRLAIDLKDSPVSYSVLNAEFLDALHITSLEQAADWAPNATRVPDHGHESTFGGAVLVAIRGVPGFFAQRDFFPMEFDFDSYNLERFDYGRGPNAVMFGFAPFSGTQNVVSKQAQLGLDSGEVRAAYGSWDNRRVTLDVNQRLGARAALRLNLLAQGRHGWRDLEEESKQAAHLAGKLRLGRQTELRAEVEFGRHTANVPYTSGYLDGILGWDGSSVYAAPQNTPAGAQALGVTSYGAWSSQGRAFVYSPSQHAESVIDLMGTGRTTTAQEGGRLGGLAVTGPVSTFAGVTMDALLHAPADRYALALRNSNLQLPGERHSFGLTTEPFVHRDYRIASVFLTHALGPLFLEGAVNWSVNNREALLTANNGTTAYLDINRTLPDGRANAMFLQPYTQGPLRRLADSWRKRNVRFSAAYRIDAGALGGYTLQGMAGAYYSERPYLYDMYGVQRHADPANWARTSEMIDYRQYWNIAKTFAPPVVATFRDAAGAVQTAPAGWSSDQRERGVQFKDDRRTTFVQASLRGRWLDNKLIGMVSAREDRLTRRTLRTMRSRDLVGTGWNGQDRIWHPLTDHATWSTLMYVPKDAAGNPTGPAQPAIMRPRDALGFALPQHEADRFQDDYSGFPIDAAVHSLFAGAVYHVRPWATFAASYSEGSDFNDAPNRWDGSVFGQKSSHGIDLALRSSFFDGRLITALTYYRGREENQGFNAEPGGHWSAINTIIRANKLGDVAENGVNARGVQANTTSGWDSRATENHGVEFEAVANPSPAWRVMFNAARPRAVQTNNAPDFRAYFESNEYTLRAILGDAGVLIDSLGQASLDPSVPPANRAPNNEHQEAANAWNRVLTAYRNVVTDGQDVRRLPDFTANLFADYTFLEGRWKGVVLGAGLNFRGRQVVGYRGGDTMRAPGNTAAAIDDPTVGPHDSVYARPYYMGMLEVGYQWRSRRDDAYRVRLKVDNLLAWDDPIYISTAMMPPGGDLQNPARVATPAVYWRMTPRSYTLSFTAQF